MSKTNFKTKLHFRVHKFIDNHSIWNKNSDWSIHKFEVGDHPDSYVDEPPHMFVLLKKFSVNRFEQVTSFIILGFYIMRRYLSFLVEMVLIRNII
jgi:hypothetical protein